MPYPATSAPTKSAGNGDTHSVTLAGTTNSGDLLLCFGGAWADEAFPPSGGGWDTIYAGDVGTDTWGCWAKVDNGSEPASYTWTTPGSRRSGFSMYRITGWGGVIATDIDVNILRSNTSSTQDFNTVTAGWGSAENLWFAYIHVINDTSTNSITTFPSGYTNDGTSGHVGGSARALIHTFRRELTAASEAPGGATSTGVIQWTSMAVVVKPFTAGASSANKYQMII